MEKEAFSTFSCCLQYRSPGNAPAWDEGCVGYYFVGLSEIPDADAPVLMKAIMNGGCGKFRPDPDEILTLWRKLTQPLPAKAEELVGKMLHLRREHGIYTRRIPDDLCCRWEICEPPWTDPLLAKISFNLGGWTAFCEDNSPQGVILGHLRAIAKSVVGGDGQETIDRLRLEYQDSRRVLAAPVGKKPHLPAPIEEPAIEEPPHLPMSRDAESVESEGFTAFGAAALRVVTLHRLCGAGED